ncbi:MAG TPA: TlpA disulfide reductase family protein [Candidatus Acidoferrum sp.]|nr:TlpA disulfide reductase family protein [Candidatus Acidoferrum sp.]
MKKNLFRRIALFGAVAVVVALAAFLPAGPAPAQDAKTEAKTNSAAAPGGKVPQSISNALAHTLAAKEAPAAWAELVEAARQPPYPAAWQLQEPSPEEQARFLMPYALAVADKAHDFYTRFATDTNEVDAREIELAMLSGAMDTGATNQQARFDAAEKSLLADPKLPDDERFELRHHAVEKAVHDKEAQGDAAMLVEFEKGTRLLQQEFPKQPRVIAMLMDLAEFSDPEKSRDVIKEIAANTDAPAEIKDAAAQMQKHLDRVGKPFALKYAASDGREVDLDKMRGKVVLVDFWATWCQPCVEMMPEVKEAYGQFHSNGFEIAGINLDQEKESFTNFVAEQKMEWPQFFDGKYWDTKYAVEFDVKDIPAMWLVDKKGVLRYINAGFDFTNKVAHLLGE